MVLPSDEVALASLRQRLLKEYPEEELERIGMCHPGRLDATLLRFFVARNRDEEEAFKMLKKSMEWRLNVDMPDIMSGPALCSEKLEAIRKYNPQGFHKTSKAGHHIYIERTGYMDVPKLLEICTQDEVVRAHTQKVEYQFHVMALHQEEKPMPRIIIIYDLGKIGFNTFRAEVFTAIQTITSLNQNHYPETLHKVYIVNAPYFFYAIHKMIEVFLPEVIRNKIGFCASPDELLDVVDADNLPAFLGGTCECFPGEEHDGCITSASFTNTHFYQELDAYFESQTKEEPIPQPEHA
ncbi:unnamed protein product [Aphanomyces euteiches]|uniref:CRAL-TRIO domain-containing protein n=1 Tax=Aphanomyces euteiches TaxID=100861 RepID=A0A6G0XVF1_9STRA|nr:hypothetical protein Ae201684_000869 [Aphanomyces euteiches]KAH9153136.1 hypothetical protein AeRB84_004557 [Aphanomyces euteiches]